MTRKINISPELKNIISQMGCDLAYLLNSDIHEETWISNPEKVFDYIGLSKSNKNHLSYLTKERIEKIQKENGDYWNSNSRYHSKPGSLMKKIFKISDREIEHFTNQFTSIVNPPNFTLEIVKGPDIASYYHYNNYYDQRGSLGCSCMKASPLNFFDIYVNNKNINMLLMLSENKKVMGRALLWDCGDVKVMDRIYTNDCINDTYFHKWAKDNGYHYKKYNNFYTAKNLVYNDEDVFKCLTVDLENSKFERYPYLDTFKWLDTNKNKLYNFIPDDLTHVITICDHMGNYFGPDHLKFCEMSGGVYLSSDIIYLDYLKKYVFCSKTIYSKVLDCNIYEEHFIKCEDINDCIFNSEYDHLNDHDKIQKYKEKLKEDARKWSLENDIVKLRTFARIAPEPEWSMTASGTHIIEQSSRNDDEDLVVRIPNDPFSDFIE